MDFVQKLAFLDKGFYKLASHDDFYWRRRHWMMDGVRETTSHSSGTFVWLPAARATFGPAACLSRPLLSTVSVSIEHGCQKNGREAPKLFWKNAAIKVTASNGNLPCPLHYILSRFHLLPLGMPTLSSAIVWTVHHAADVALCLPSLREVHSKLQARVHSVMHAQSWNAWDLRA